MLDSCKIVEKLFTNQEQIRDAIALVVTNINPEDLGCTVLDEVNTGNSWLLKHFQSRETGRNRNVFYFPSPKESMINNICCFDDRENILNFIRNGPATCVSPRISLSDQSLYLIIKSIDSFGCLSNLLLKFVDQIIINYSEPSSDLNLWKNRVDQFCRETYSDPNEFVNKAKRIITPSNPHYDDLYQKFNRIHQWSLFLKKVIREEYSGEEFELNRNNPLLSPVFLDITTFLSKFL